MEQKAFTVRLDTDQATDLEAVAAADGVSVAEKFAKPSPIVLRLAAKTQPSKNGSGSSSSRTSEYSSDSLSESRLHRPCRLPRHQ